MTRTQIMRVATLVMVVAGRSSLARARPPPRRQPGRGAAAPVFAGRSALAEAAAESLDSRIGHRCRVDRQDHIWIVHRGLDSLTGRTEAGMSTRHPRLRSLLLAAPPVLEFDRDRRARRPLGRAGQGFDWPVSPGGIAVDAKGQRVDCGRRRDRRAGAAAVAAAAGAARSAAAGGAAAPPPRRRRQPTRTCSSSRATASSCCRSASPATPRQGQQDDAQPSGRRRRRLSGQRGLRRRRLGTQPRRRLRRDDRRVQAALGRVRREAGRCRARPYEPAGEPAKQFRAVSCVAVAKDGQVYVCDRAEQSHPGVQEGRRVREEKVSSRRRRAGTARPGTSRSRPIRSSSSCMCRRPGREGLGRCAAPRSSRWPALATAAGSPAVLRRRQRRLDSKGNVYTGETFEGKRVQKLSGSKWRPV